MRIWKTPLALATLLTGFWMPAQSVRPSVGRSIILTNRMVVSSNAVTSKGITPNLAISNVTPAIGRQGITPALPNPGTPAIVQTQGFNTAIGQQGFGGALGRQGSGTAIGQQGSGTAIGQQGVGTAIVPGNNPVPPANNAIVIGQPEPFVSAPANAPVQAPGFTTNLPNGLSQRTMPFPPGGLTNAPIRPVMPTPVLPATRAPSPTGRR